MNNKDEIVVKKILQYADEISETISRFNLSKESFSNDFVVRNAISMCIFPLWDKKSVSFRTRFFFNKTAN